MRSLDNGIVEIGYGNNIIGKYYANTTYILNYQLYSLIIQLNQYSHYRDTYLYTFHSNIDIMHIIKNTYSKGSKTLSYLFFNILTTHFRDNTLCVIFDTTF